MSRYSLVPLMFTNINPSRFTTIIDQSNVDMAKEFVDQYDIAYVRG